MRRVYLYRTLACLALVAAGCQAEHEKFVKKDRENWDKQRLGIMYQVAEQQFKVGELDKCRASVEEGLKVNAPYAGFHILAARLDLEGGSLEHAADQLKQAIAITPEDPEPYYLLGVVYQRWQQFDTAGDYYQRACDKKPSEATYVLALAEMRIASGDLDHARDLLEAKSMYFEQSAAMRVALARIATLQGDPAAASRYYRDATLLLPEDSSLRWTYAQSLMDAGKYSDAVRILEDMQSNPAALITPAKSRLESQDKSTQPEVTQEALDSTRVTLLMMTGECYVNLKRPLDARDCYQKVVRIQPGNASAFVSLGKACLLTSELSLTAEAADRALRLEPDNVDAMILQATVQQKNRQWTQSMETLAAAARIAPKNSTVLCMQGLGSLQLGRKDAATTFFTRAVAANPRDAWANELLESVKPTAAAEMPHGDTLTNAAPAKEEAGQ